MKALKLLILGLLLSGVSAMIPFLTISASQLKPSVRLASTDGVDALVSSINSYSNELSVDFNYLYVEYTATNGSMVTVDTYGYSQLSSNDRNDLMSYTLSQISDSSVISIDRTKLYNFICETDTSVSSLVRRLSSDSKVDFYNAYVLFKPFTGKVGIILALFAIGLFVGIIFTILIDIFYICIPAVTCLLNSGDSDKKPRVVSKEAYKAYLVCNEDNNKHDALLTYFKKKWIQFVIVCVCILYLASGKIWDFVGDVFSLFEGIV